MDENRLFKLQDLNQAFWNKVILIQIRSTTGMGGEGCIWIVTSEKKEYFIGMFSLHCSEHGLEKLTPILKRKEKIIDYAHPYEVENNGWKYLPKHRTLVRDDFYKRFMNSYEFHMKAWSDRGLYSDHMPMIAGYALGVGGELERYDEEESYKRQMKQWELFQQADEERRCIALEKEHFVWKPIYPNNNPDNEMLYGEYAFIFKEEEERVTGHKFSIVYQRKEIVPLRLMGKNGPIECYNLFLQKFEDVQGPLECAYDSRSREYRQAFDDTNTLNDYTVNSYGDFIRSFKSVEDAKVYALEIANAWSCANKNNIITDLDNKERQYKGWLRKYEGILAFRRYFTEIVAVLDEYEFPSESVTGGGFIFGEVKEKLDIEEELLKELWQYIPLILSKQTQDKARDMVRECRSYIETNRDEVKRGQDL